MNDLVPLAEMIASRLTARRQTIAVAESSTGGLICAALLAVPGASAYFLGGAVIYTGAARAALMGITPDDMQKLGLRPSTEPYASLLATRIREQHGAAFGLGETGATGPSGNRYGDKAGHTCIAIAGAIERSVTIETGNDNRQANMRAFAKHALTMLAEMIR